MTKRETLLAEIQKEIEEEQKVTTNDIIKLRLSNLKERVARAKILVCKKYN
jgi:hypothetical protein